MKNKIKYILLAIVSISLFCLLSLPADENTKQKSEKLVFKNKIGTLVKGEKHDFEKKYPGLGISVPYNAPGITLTIYKYNMGMKKIPEDTSSKVLQKHFKIIQSNIYSLEKEGKYKSVKKLLTETTDIGKEKKALHSEFEYIQSGKKRKSHIYLWVHNDNFIKIRFTYDIEKKEVAEKDLKLVLKDLNK